MGLARPEFILTCEVRVHSLAPSYRQEPQDFLETGKLAPVSERFHGRLEAEGEEELRGILGAIDRRTAAYANKRRFFVDLVMEGVGLICAAFHPHPVLVCLSAPAVQPVPRAARRSALRARGGEPDDRLVQRERVPGP